MPTKTDEATGGPPHRTFQNHDDETPSETVVRAVATTSGRSAFAPATSGREPLDPLYEAIDPEALDALFSTGADDSTGVGSVEFVYSGYEIAVEQSGTICVSEG